MRRSPFARARLLAVVVAASLPWAHVSGGASRRDEPAKPSSLAAALTAMLAPDGDVESLIFPALTDPNVPGRSWQRCAAQHGAEPPQWLRAIAATTVCDDGLRQRAGRADGAQPQDLLTAAAVCDDAETVRRLLGAGAAADEHDSCGLTALAAAGAAAAGGATEALLSAGANPNLETRQGRWSKTPLAAAIERGNAGVVEALLRAGANPNMATPAGRTPLMLAAAIGQPDMIEGLVRHGANACAHDDSGLTALDVAQARGVSGDIAALRRAIAKCSPPKPAKPSKSPKKQKP